MKFIRSKKAISISAALASAVLLSSCQVDLINPHKSTALSSTQEAASPGVPLSISGLKLWLKADDLLTSHNDGDSVARWSDASGNRSDATQTSATNKPVYKSNQVNGKPVVRFDGTDDFLSIPSLIYRTIFIVAKYAPSSFPDYNGILGSDPDSDGAYPNSGYLVNGYAGTAKIAQGTSAIASAYRNGSAVNFSGGYDFAPINNFWLGSFVFGANQTEPAQLGAIDRNLNGHRYWYGDFAEVLVYDTALADADRTRVEAYLNAKYGLY